MCGIAGKVYLNKNIYVTRKEIKNMIEKITYRGPDNEGIYLHKNIGLGFRRLSIIDLSLKANQPMKNDNGRLIIIYNGEIYNYNILKMELEKNGYSFKTKSDTEVLLKLFEAYGKNCLRMLNGMFSFAIYDKLKDSLFIARDRAGIKPLYYYYSNEVFIWASEIKSLLSNKEVSNTISNKGLSQYLSLGYTLAPNTIYSNIFKLMPGHYIELLLSGDKSNIKQQKYWDILFTEDYTKFESINDWGKEFYSLFTNSVSLRLNADVPFGLFLSGGLDSSAIAIIASELTDKQINTFTIDFENSQCSEVNTAKQLVAKYKNIKHHIFKLDIENLWPNFEVLNMLDEPFSDSSIIPTFLISKCVKNAGFSMALSGDGGDEILAGYFSKARFKLNDFWYKYTNSRMRLCIKNILQYLPNKRINEEFLERLCLNQYEMYWFEHMATSTVLFSKIFKDDFIKFVQYGNYELLFPEPYSSFKKIMQLYETMDFKYRLADGYETKIDRASMYNSLEVRFPFLDFRIVELLSSMPSKYKLRGNTTKVLLKYVFRHKYPKAVINQRKMGFSIPLRDWVHGRLRREIELNIINSPLSNSINNNALEYLFNTGIKLDMYNRYTEMIWRLYVLSLFMKNWSIDSIY